MQVWSAGKYRKKILIVIVCFFCTAGYSRGDNIPWIPFHIKTEIESESTHSESRLLSLLQSDFFNLGSLLLIEVLRFGSYRHLSRNGHTSGAYLTSEILARAADASLDYYTSDTHSEFGLRAILSNADLIPWWYRLPGVFRRSTPFLTLVMRRLYRWWQLSAVPSKIYLHDRQLSRMLEIIWVPAKAPEQSMTKLTDGHHFILAGKKSGQPCHLNQASNKPSIYALAHGLSCFSELDTEIDVHLYPRPLNGENRVFVRLFYNGKPGALYLLPQHFGKTGETVFFNDAIAAGFSGFPDKISNPLHERIFDSIRYQILYESRPTEPVPDSLEDAIVLPAESHPVEYQTIEGESLLLVSAGEQGFLVFDKGRATGSQPVISLETRYSLTPETRDQLDWLEASRPDTVSEYWLLTFEMLNLMAIQFLAGKMLEPLGVAATESKIKVATDEPAPGKQAAVHKAGGGDDDSLTGGGMPNVDTRAGEIDRARESSQRPRRTVRKPWRFRDDLPEDKPPRRPSNKRRPKHKKIDLPESPRGLKRMRTEGKGSLVTVLAPEPEGEARKRNLLLQAEGSDSDTWFCEASSVPGSIKLTLHRVQGVQPVEVSTGVTGEPLQMFSYQFIDSLSALDTVTQPQASKNPSSGLEVDLGVEELTLTSLGFKEDGVTRLTVVDESKPRRALAGESDEGIACPVIGCNTRSGKHYRLSSYKHWWWHVKKHIGLTYDDRVFSSDHDFGEYLLVRQGLVQCPMCDGDNPYPSLVDFGRHLVKAHYCELEQQKFNPYQSQRLLQVTNALNIQAETGYFPFVAGNQYACGIGGCEHVFLYKNDQSMYQETLNHRGQFHPKVRVGAHFAGKRLLENFDHLLTKKVRQASTALMLVTETDGALFIVGHKYACGLPGCSFTIEYKDDLRLFNDLQTHRDLVHPDIVIGKSTASRDVVDSMSAPNYRYLGKKFQTRCGGGFKCLQHPTVTIKQFPEGLAWHHNDYHEKETYFCPVADCLDSQTGLRMEFASAEMAYLHQVHVHQPEYLQQLENIISDHQGVGNEIPISILADGWIPIERIKAIKVEIAKKTAEAMDTKSFKMQFDSDYQDIKYLDSSQCR